MILKEIKDVAKLLSMMSDYKDIPAIVNYMIKDCKFTEEQVLRLVQDIKNYMNLFLNEIVRLTRQANNIN